MEHSSYKETEIKKWNEILKTYPPKKIARYSLPYFAQYYLGLDVPRHQEEWYKLLFKYPQEFLLSPRDHGKTTVLPRVIAEHKTLFQQDHREQFGKDFNILLISKTYSQSKKSLQVIKKDLTKNKLIQRDFKEELKDLHGGGNQLFYNQVGISRDATVEGNGLLGDITGSHFFFIILDDIIDDENCRTRESRRNVMKWVNGTILPLLEPEGRILGIGTRKHYEDAYQEMITNPMWYVIQQKAIIEAPESYDIVYDKNGMAVGIENIVGTPKTLWPEKWDIEKLLLKKVAMGSILFNREYQNDASFMKGKILKDYWLKKYALYEENTDLNSGIGLAPPKSSMTIYQGYDLAIKRGEANDYLVCTTIGVTQNNLIYILDWYRDKIPFPKQVKLVKTLYDKWEPIQIGIESNQYQLALKEQVLDERILPIKEVISTKNKTERIILGSVTYENGLVYLPVDHPQYNNFMEEYTSFDEGEHDDMIDSTDITMKLTFKPKGLMFNKKLRSSVHG